MVAGSNTGYAVVETAAPNIRIKAGDRAQKLLRFGFTLLPIVAGIDKFFYLLTDWSAYLAPAVAERSPLGTSATMWLIGAIEILAGLIVAVKPRIGGLIVAAWLAAIIANLVLLGTHWDIALRDVGLMFGAIALALLSRARPRRAYVDTRDDHVSSFAR